jgi:type II secretory pathway component PulC
VIRSESYYQLRDGRRITINEKTPDPVGLVRFFELSDVGLVICDQDEKGNLIRYGIRVRHVRKDSIFDNKLQVGDVVTCLEKAKITSAEMFRRLLRQRMGNVDPVLTYTVRRGGKTLVVPIAVKD